MQPAKNGELGGAAFCVEGAIRFPAGFSSEEDTESFPLRGLWKGGESFLFIGQAVFQTTDSVTGEQGAGRAVVT